MAFQAESKNIMKLKTVLVITGCFLIAGLGCTYLGWYLGVHSDALSRETAINIAMENVGSGVPKNARLNRSKGVVVWEVNLVQAGNARVTEVRIHAMTGEVLATTSESIERTNEELAEVARHLGITPELLEPRPTKNAKKPVEAAGAAGTK